MSRQPPLPPGPPPPPGYSDSYRPGQQNYQFGQNSGYGRSNDMYQFGSNNQQRNDRGPSRDFDYRSNPPPGLSSNGGTDSYRPSDGGFSFRQAPPPGVDFSQSDNYRPGMRQRPRDGRRNDNRPRGRGGYRGRASKRASDRPMLNSTRAPTPELMPGMDEDDGAAARFRDIDDVSDSEEAEMDMSSDDEEQEDGEQPRKKQARTESKPADGDSVPRWSNPDPYTALPPPDESQRKKKDVVKLIRKARVVAAADEAAKPEAVTDDFISFDFGDEIEEQEESDDASDDASEHSVPAGAPTGPRFSHRDQIQGQLPPQSEPDISTMTPVSKRPIDDSALGSRKRTYDDEIKPPPFIESFKPPRGPSKGSISSEWRKNSMTDPTPWCMIDHSKSLVGLRLHKEIMDFYDHFKPRDFEAQIRHRLVNNLRDFVRDEIGDADVRCFGSFPAGLYLPTADMDLVLVSDRYMQGGRALYDSKNTLYKFRQMLERNGIAVKGHTDVIAKARVPLVKYVDALTGLKVDVSFENVTGITANKTFQDWKDEFPAMPILVTLIKQFLAMRGLNEPVNGGIGGFTVTCLVVSMLQTMPQVQSRNLIPEHHLGEMLMEFFNLYGKKFNADVTAIQFDPPGLVPKSRVQTQVYNKPSNITKFCIIDPNNPSNDIAGGSSNTRTIIEAFADAHDALQKTMAEIYTSQTHSNTSILGCIIGGNYRSFDVQREHLLHVWERQGPSRGDERRY